MPGSPDAPNGATEGRTRRSNAGRGRTGSAARTALEELRALKADGSKGRRAATFEVRNADSVYDVVDEQDYAALVAKRRREGGGFIEDDTGGSGYADIGEEVDWSTAAGEGGDEEGGSPGGSTLPQKRKGKDGKDGKRSTKSKGSGVVDPEGRRRMQSMLMAGASANRVTVKPVTDEESDDLLNDILSGLGGGGAGEELPSVTAVRHKPAPPPAVGFSRVPTPNAGAKRSGPSPSQAATAATTRVAPGSRVPARPPRTFAAPLPRPTSTPSSRQAHHAPDNNLQEAIEEPTGGQMEAKDEEMLDVGEYQLEEGDIGVAEEEVKGEEGEEEDLRAILEEETGAKGSAAGVGGKGALMEDEDDEGGKGWAELCAAVEEDGGDEKNEEEDKDKAEDMAVEGGDVPFFVLDVHEERNQPGSVYLFGKVPRGDKYVSACAVVKDMVRTVIVVPQPGVMADPSGRMEELLQLSKADVSKKRDLNIHLQELAKELKSEVKEVLARHGITRTTISVVQRSYAFEERGVPHGQQWVLKVKYPAERGALPVGLSGRLFTAVFGVTTSLSEALIVRRTILGPSWMTLKNAVTVDASRQVSWCAVELEVSGPKAVITSGEVTNRDAPPLVVASLHIKTHVNPSSNANEVVSASVLSMSNAKIDGPTSKEEWNTPKQLRHFSVVRKLDNTPWPLGFQAKVEAANESPAGRRNGGAMLSMQSSERALLTYLLARLRTLDADVYVGHNIAGFDIDVLLHRLQQHKVPHWSRIGRLKRNHFPNLNGGGNVFGGGASQGALTALSGRLLCDTYLAAREFVKEVDYTLATLAKSLLGQSRSELLGGNVLRSYESADSLMAMVEHTNSDAWLAMGLMFHLSVLPLTRQLTCLSGFQWSKTLSGARAQRIEMLLLHEFHARKFITPDRLSARDKAQLAKLRGGGGDGEAEGVGKKGGKGPQYSGGLVLEPKKGLYDKFVLLLDFNSLYPSIIQEYNICFTTVDRPQDGEMAPLPKDTEVMAPLPSVIRKLVQRRRQVKELLKREGDAVRKEQLNIRQQALKLTANSMYGCLGFGNSRFYCKPLAELITSQGREILQSTVDLVERSVGLEIIYGDTDSIMINTATDNLPDVFKMGQAVKKEVNKRYRMLEIEVDGVYKSMLLLKKKKYAAMKVEVLPSGDVKQEMEQKGLDIVRRDWCPLSKDCGNFALTEIMSGKPQEEVVEAIHAHLQQVKEAVHSGQVAVNKFVITKQLTKQPEDYPDAKNQPHVQVALRRKAAGKRNGVAAGETVPYIICMLSTEGGGADTRSLAERAYHPEELKADDKLRVDAEYYLGQQVHPVVSRLCSPIQGTDPGHLALCLGLDATRFQGNAPKGGSGAELREELDAVGSGSLLDDEDTYKACDPLWLTNAEGVRFKVSPARALASGDVATDSALAPTPSSTPLTPAQLANQATLAARAAIDAYYAAPLRSDDEVAPHETRDVSLRVVGASTPGTLPADAASSAAMLRSVTEGQLYTQLTSFARQFDVSKAIKSAGAGEVEREDASEAQALAEQRLSPVRRAYDAALASIQKFSDRCIYKWINMSHIYGDAPQRALNA